jgi:hypothetical protein
MPNTPNQQSESNQADIYQIRVKGHLGSNWADWFDGMNFTKEANGDTLLTGPVIDQAALHGLLRKVRDVGIPLLSFLKVEPNQDDAADEGLRHQQLQETEAGP